MGGDVDIMGVKRGAHRDGVDICPKFEFKIPGGVNPDGTVLWGWNDAASASCKNCGRRDLEHVVLRDFTAESLEEDRRNALAKKAPPPPPVAPTIRADATAANPTASAAAEVEEASALQTAAAKLGMFELEPGVPDPLALNAYNDVARDVKKEEQRVKSARAARLAAGAVESIMSKDSTASSATGDGDGGLDEENERFKAEVERMVKEQLAKEKLSMLNAPVAGDAQSIKEMLGSLGLERYLAAFEEEAMEMSVLVTLARSEGKEALDEVCTHAPVCVHMRTCHVVCKCV